MTYRCYPHCPQLPVDNSNLANCLWITFDGGEGGRSVGQSCGSIRPTEKAKMEKSANAPLSAMKKKELVAPMGQGMGAIQQRKKPNGAKPFPPTRLGTVALPQ
jgi:hypothetical protein